MDSDTSMMNIRVERIVKETEKAVLVEFTDDRNNVDQTWLPKSQIECHGDEGDTNVLIEIPEWLAEDKGLDHLSD